MTSKHHGRQHLRLITSSSESGVEREREAPDFTQGSVEGSLKDVLAAAKQGEHLTHENFQDSDFMAARRRRAAEKAGHTLGVAYEPVDTAQFGADIPTEQSPPVPHRPDDAS